MHEALSPLLTGVAPHARRRPRTFTFSDDDAPLGLPGLPLDLSSPLLDLPRSPAPALSFSSHSTPDLRAAAARTPVVPARDEWREDDLSDSLRRDFVRYTIVGIVTSTRTANAEAALAAPERRDEGDGAAGATGAAGPGSQGWAELVGGLEELVRTASRSSLFGGPTDHQPPATPPRTPPRPGAVPTPPGFFAAPDSPTPRRPRSASTSPALPPRRASWNGTPERLTRSALNLLSPPTAPPKENQPNGALAAMPLLQPSHFAEVSTHELAPGVTFRDFAPLVWQVLRQQVHKVSFTAYTHSLSGANALELEACIEAMVGQFSEGGGGAAGGQ